MLRATGEFETHKKTAERRIFEVVNSKIDDLLETAEYEWSVFARFSPKVMLIIVRMSTTPAKEPSNYISTLTGYLENIMSSTLLGLPHETRSLVYFDALGHATEEIVVSTLGSSRAAEAKRLTDIDRNYRWILLWQPSIPMVLPH